MSEKQMEQADKQIKAELAQRSEQCERGAIAIRADGLAGIARVAPNLLVEAFVVVPGLLIADCYLN
jgi:hypothetical protein